MNSLQKTEFDILRAFIEICTQLDLSYYLVCGSALGAVKYGGFIPWDDDIDVAMRREDYKVFVEKARQYLPSYYFLQTYSTDPEYPNFFAKIRDSRTTFMEKSVRHRRMNHGVYIDVFPLDGYPDSPSQIKRLERLKKRYQLRLCCAYMPHKEQKLTTRLFFQCERILGYHRRTASAAAKLDGLLSAYPTADSRLWCNHGNWQGRLEYAPREQYGDGTQAMFEGLKVTVPKQYDAYLTQKYGDWRADLPQEEKVGHHSNFVCDLNRPYQEYI